MRTAAANPVSPTIFIFGVMAVIPSITNVQILYEAFILGVETPRAHIAFSFNGLAKSAAIGAFVFTASGRKWFFGRRETLAGEGLFWVFRLLVFAYFSFRFILRTVHWDLAFPFSLGPALLFVIALFGFYVIAVIAPGRYSRRLGPPYRSASASDGRLVAAPVRSERRQRPRP